MDGEVRDLAVKRMTDSLAIVVLVRGLILSAAVIWQNALGSQFVLAKETKRHLEVVHRTLLEGRTSMPSAHTTAGQDDRDFSLKLVVTDSTAKVHVSTHAMKLRKC